MQRKLAGHIELVQGPADTQLLSKVPGFPFPLPSASRELAASCLSSHNFLIRKYQSSSRCSA